MASKKGKLKLNQETVRVLTASQSAQSGEKGQGTTIPMVCPPCSHIQRTTE